ncbi:MAG: hypothetical protein U5K74_10150 [Gemmatimonadaceae bacterium]|nr:hypothetical protein [Gemmatimonadaceae bacterium]
MLTFVGFAFFAAIFHYLCWQWRPWLGKPLGYAAAQLTDMVEVTTRFLS